MIIRQFVSQRTQMFLSIYLIIFPRVHFIYSVFCFLSVLKADVHWSIWFLQRDTTKLKGEVLPVTHLWLAAGPSFWGHSSLSTPATLHFFFLGHKIEGFHGTKLRRNQVQGWDTKADNKGWPHPIKGLRGKVNQKKIKPRIKVNILTSNMTAPTLSYTKGQCAKAAFEGSLVWVPLSSGKSWLCLTLKPSDLRMWVTGYSLKCITSCIKQIQSWSPNIS